MENEKEEITRLELMMKKTKRIMKRAKLKKLLPFIKGIFFVLAVLIALVIIFTIIEFGPMILRTVF